MSEELLPCSFCGEAAEIQYAEHVTRTTWWIVCRNTKCVVYVALRALPSKDEAIAGWNARASQWRDIETAPKDGTHIMACRGPFTSNWTFAQAPAYVCHWWNNPGEEGWYLSSGDSGQISWHPTHWQPLPQPPVSK